MMVLGRIVAPFGIKGWVRVAPMGDDPETWESMPRWWVSRDDQSPEEDWQTLTLKTCKIHGPGLVAAFDEVPDRNAAEALKGWFIGAPREAMPDPGADTYYWGDLIGLQVANQSGEYMGEVVGLLTTGAHDVLRVKEGDAERLIPFVAAYALEVNFEQRTITVDWQKDW